MTKKQRKRLSVKRLGTVLLTIILGASSVQAATPAGVRTRLEFSAVEQTAAAGSLIIRLAPKYLETLSTGEHTLTACFEDGNDPTVKFTILAAAKDEKEENSGRKNKSDSSQEISSKKKSSTVLENVRENTSVVSPKTGDENRTGLWLTIMIFSVLGAVLVVVFRKAS